MSSARTRLFTFGSAGTASWRESRRPIAPRPVTRSASRCGGPLATCSTRPPEEGCQDERTREVTVGTTTVDERRAWERRLAMNVDRRPGERRQLGLMLAPYTIGLIGLVLLPAAVTLALACADYDLIRPPEWIGFGNLAMLADDPIFRIALRNSLVFAAVAVPLRLLVALGLALLLHRRTVLV